MEPDRGQARAGRDQLVAVLYARDRPGLVRLAFGLVGDLSEAEEIVQDAFAALLRRWNALRDVEAAPGYLYTAVVNGANARHRQRKIRERVGAMIGRPAPAASLPDIAEQSSVLDAIRQLPARKRACVLLRYYADLSESETAAVLGVSVGTVKSQTAKALARLAELLEPQRAEVPR